jgi:hypothetical protein
MRARSGGNRRKLAETSDLFRPLLDSPLPVILSEAKDLMAIATDVLVELP